MKLTSHSWIAFFSTSTVAIFSFSFSSFSAAQTIEQHLLTSLALGPDWEALWHLYLPKNLSLLVFSGLVLCFQDPDIWNIHSNCIQIPVSSLLCLKHRSVLLKISIPKRLSLYSLYRSEQIFLWPWNIGKVTSCH